MVGVRPWGLSMTALMVAPWFRYATDIVAIDGIVYTVEGMRGAADRCPLMSAFGASSSLRCVRAKVSSANAQCPLTLGGGNWSSCPTTADRFGRRRRQPMPPLYLPFGPAGGNGGRSP